MMMDGARTSPGATPQCWTCDWRRVEGNSKQQSMVWGVMFLVFISECYVLLNICRMVCFKSVNVSYISWMWGGKVDEKHRLEMEGWDEAIWSNVLSSRQESKWSC